jgi:hypothetical protein
MGHGFESTVRMSATPADAIDDLLPKYPALGVMAQRHVWFLSCTMYESRRTALL